jgi:hypothetical protein
MTTGNTRHAAFIMEMKMRAWIAGGCAAAALMTMACGAAAQAPAIGPGSAEDAVLQKQRQAGAAYRELQQAQYAARLAEQDFLNAQEAAAQEETEERKRQLETAKKALAAAQAKVAQARKRYDDAVTGVDQAFRKK